MKRDIVGTMLNSNSSIQDKASTSSGENKKIKKLKIQDIPSIEGSVVTAPTYIFDIRDIKEKLNEIIDAINKPNK